MIKRANEKLKITSFYVIDRRTRITFGLIDFANARIGWKHCAIRLLLVLLHAITASVERRLQVTVFFVIQNIL